MSFDTPFCTQSVADSRIPPVTGADLKVRFVGAINGVTGSCAWLHHEPTDTEILVDCGLYQGDLREEAANRKPFPFDPKRIQFVLVTHAHLDHCGMLPRLVSEGFSGLVYATAATRDLALVMLENALSLNQALSPKLLKRITWSVFDQDLGFKWGRTISLADGLTFSVKRSSHVLGACVFTVNVQSSGAGASQGWKGICFSGDVGREKSDDAYLGLLKHGHQPFPSTADIVIEATYGAQVRDPKYDSFDQRMSELGRIIRETRAAGGTTFFPAFAFHRSQEVMMDILCASRMEHFAPLRLVLHSELSRKVMKVYAHILLERSPNGKMKYFNRDRLEALGVSEDDLAIFLLELVSNGRARLNGVTVEYVSGKAIHQQAGDVIIASSGMCDHGPAAEYLEFLADDVRNAVVFTGYQATGSMGGKFKGRATSEAGWKGCRSEDLSPFYSGHADQAGLLEFLFSLGGVRQDENGTRVLINHGDPVAKRALREAIIERSARKNTGDRKINGVELANARWLPLA